MRVFEQENRVGLKDEVPKKGMRHHFLFRRGLDHEFAVERNEEEVPRLRRVRGCLVLRIANTMTYFQKHDRGNCLHLGKNGKAVLDSL